MELSLNISIPVKIFNETFDHNAIITEDKLSAAEFLADVFIDPQPVTSPDLSFLSKEDLRVREMNTCGKAPLSIM